MRLQQAPIWHYMNSSQYRYDGHHTEYNTVPDKRADRCTPPTRSSRPCAWAGCPSSPVQAELAGSVPEEAEAGGSHQRRRASSEYVLEKLKSKDMEYAVSDPEAPESSSPGSGTSGVATPSSAA